MASRKRVRRANPYELYRTCKAANTCPRDVIPLVEGNTLADQILKWGSWAVYLGGLGIGTGTQSISGRPITTGSVKSNIEKFLVNLFGKGGTQTRAPTGGIPLETLGAGTSLGTPDVAVTATDAPTVVVPEAPSGGEPGEGLGVVTENTQETAFTYVDVDDTGEIMVVNLRPDGDDPTSHLSSSTTFHNPTYQEPSGRLETVGETSNTENIFLAGENLGSTGGEEIELSLFSKPRTSTPRQSPRAPVRGRANWFSRRYYTQLNLNNPAVITQPGEVIGTQFVNPVFEGSSFEAPPAYESWNTELPELRDATHYTASRLLQGPSGRVGVDRVATTRTIGTRSGIRIGPEVHVRQSLSSISDAVEFATFVSGDVETAPTVETAFVEETAPFEDIDLDSVYSDEDLLDQYPATSHGRLVFGERFNRDIVPIPIDPPFTALVPVDVTTYVTPGANWPDFTPGSKGGMTPGIIIDLSEELFKHYYLHESLLRRKRRRRKRLYA
ncbi:L2 [Camelus dromedarius papillomavirus 2]|uniref:Minor capsid protein L2 n=1 Tax=Camelus dromedarius papillomavirus 2 TaxID=996651 RepID=F2YGI0_9PAPI|nr:L2 [Camelus dromedarius papillomavirus 2]ADZ53061.1 L2 [Camelus dromedarius papillomavirus 2]